MFANPISTKPARLRQNGANAPGSELSFRMPTRRAGCTDHMKITRLLAYRAHFLSARVAISGRAESRWMWSTARSCAWRRMRGWRGMARRVRSGRLMRRGVRELGPHLLGRTLGNSTAQSRFNSPATHRPSSKNEQLSQTHSALFSPMTPSELLAVTAARTP